jgi:hypothetical protein
VEVGDEAVDGGEFVARLDEDAGVAGEGLAGAGGGGGFEDTERCGADGYDAAAVGTTSVRSALTGRKVPAPTWRVTVSTVMPRTASASQKVGVKRVASIRTDARIFRSATDFVPAPWKSVM